MLIVTHPYEVGVWLKEEQITSDVEDVKRRSKGTNGREYAVFHRNSYEPTRSTLFYGSGEHSLVSPYPQVIIVPKNNSNLTAENDGAKSEPETAINVALHPPTKTRLTAYKNRNPIENLSYNEAIEKVLDEIGFPPVEEIENQYLPSLAGGRSTQPEEERSNSSA